MPPAVAGYYAVLAVLLFKLNSSGSSLFAKVLFLGFPVYKGLKVNSMLKNLLSAISRVIISFFKNRMHFYD